MAIPKSSPTPSSPDSPEASPESKLGSQPGSQPGPKPEPSEKYSYSSTEIGTQKRFREFYYIVKKILTADNIVPKWTVDTYKSMCEDYEAITGESLKGKKLLDIGPGQNKRFMHCFGLDNDVLGIDMDVLPKKITAKVIAEMYAKNSGVRVLKTLGRKLIRSDERFIKKLYEALGATEHNDPKVIVGNAENMALETGSFDMVYSFSVFEHLHNPRAAIQEVVRVLKPGGVAQISLHLYTSHSGIHDPKIFASWEPQPPYWPHLRPEHAHSVQPNSWLNKIRLDDWEQMFEQEMPGAMFEHSIQEELKPHLKELKANGELAGYSDQELLAINLYAVWRKPS